MSHHSFSSTEEKALKRVLWGSELSFEKRTCTFRPQEERKENCRLLLSAICLGEKTREEVNRVEILPTATREDKRPPSVTIASLKASVLPMVTMGVELSPPVTFHLRSGFGPVFLCGQECYETSDLSCDEEEEEAEEEEEENEDDDDDGNEADVSLEETPPVKQAKRQAPQKQMSAAKKKKLEKEEEMARSSLQEKSPGAKGKAAVKPKKPKK